MKLIKSYIKKYDNQVGSMPLALIFVFILMTCVVALSSLYMSERINLSMSMTSDVEEIYAQDSVIETTINVILQSIITKEYDEVEDMEFFDYTDLQKIEGIVNDDAIPAFGLKGYKVFLKESYEPPTIDYFCVDNSDVETVHQYECLNESFDLEFDIQVQKDTKVKEYVLEFNHLYPKVTETRDKISISLDDYEFKMKR